MNEFAFSMETLLMVLPLIVLQLGLVIFCVVKIFREGVQNLNRWAWLGICLFFSLIGPLAFLIIGRKAKY